VTDFRVAIKAKFPLLLKEYDPAQFTLYKPDGAPVIDPGTEVANLAMFGSGTWKPLVATVESNGPITRSKKQLNTRA
jgi:hypothetical protein